MSQKRYKKLMDIWAEIHEILDKNQVSMTTHKGSIALYDQLITKQPDHSIVIKEIDENQTQIFHNVPF